MNENNDIHLSKTLCWILRHEAKKLGLPIQVNGYLPVSLILKHPSLRNYSTTDVERVVVSNDKQRFSLRNNNGVLEICANQGHSISVVDNSNLIPLSGDENIDVIHGTFYKNWESIKIEGLSRDFLEDRRYEYYLQHTVNPIFFFNMQKTQKTMSNAIDNLIPEVSNTKPFCCLVCKITLHTRAALQQHLLSFEHNQVLKSNKMKPYVIGQLSGVFVTGISSSCRTDHLLSYFSRFGNIVWICRKNYLLVEYAEQTSVEKILRLTQHFVSGEKLFVKKRESTPQDAAPIAQQSMQSITFMERLKTTVDISEQVAELIAHVRGSESYTFTPQHGVICKDIYEAIQYSYPRCRIHPFGSSITGLHFGPVM
ncbi:unnamed protein product [Diabrotica balteata]|uniref:2'-phosphotransferase n=1 Tax=Diabrotica balteata TaxID=107213 RepID=A0A9N9SPV7_DIABA|nr:unnamed protein product [Diabrotica balteata]